VETVSVRLPSRTAPGPSCEKLNTAIPSANDEKLAGDKLKTNGVGPDVPKAPVQGAPTTHWLTCRLSRKSVTGAVLPLTEFPKVPLNVAEPISNPAGSVKLNVVAVKLGRGKVPPIVNGALKSGTVTVIVSARVDVAELIHRMTNMNAAKLSLCERDMAYSSLLCSSSSRAERIVCFDKECRKFVQLPATYQAVNGGDKNI
jgi:hypothetical protein